MGKNFESELNLLGDVYKSAFEADSSMISSFLQINKDKFFLLIGSGGSYSMASAFEFMCTKAGLNSKKITPLEVSSYKKNIPDCAIVLFTAGGRNKDTLNCYKYINTLEASSILTICMTKDAPLKKIQANNVHNFYFEFAMPVKKDGFLAVESLISSIVISTNAFKRFTNNDFFKLDKPNLSRNSITSEIENVLGKETVIVLCAGLTVPSAVDMESKFGETSLGNIQVVDYRNFAHGRHFWLENRKNTTGIIALISEKEKNIANKTLELIPRDIPTCEITIDKNNSNGLIESFMLIFEIVNIAGKKRNIDPGKPRVADFGKKLYHLSYNQATNDDIIKVLKSDVVARAIYRKFGFDLIGNNNIYDLCKSNYKEICNKMYKGVVFDYDGTLHLKGDLTEVESEIFDKINYLLEKGIVVGIATGRGKSVRLELQNRISDKYWNDVVIAYYNGGCIGTLAQNEIPNKKNIEVSKEFEKIIDLFLENEITLDGLEEKNPYQLSFFESFNSIETVGIVSNLLYNIDNIKIVKSSHSIDIIPITSSKNAIFKYYEEHGFQEEDFLCVGDSGNFGGNDFELLNRQFSLSVDHVSTSKVFCWNFFKLGLRNIEATVDLLNNVIINESTKEFKLGGF